MVSLIFRCAEGFAAHFQFKPAFLGIAMGQFGFCKAAGGTFKIDRITG
jgi:hypothetical protein